MIVSVEKLMELKGPYCPSVTGNAMCGAAIPYSAKQVGAQVTLEWKCGKGHFGRWESSEVLSTKRNQAFPK